MLKASGFEQRITYQRKLCKWLAEQKSVENSKNTTKEIVKNPDRPLPKGTPHKKKKKKKKSKKKSTKT